jgi:uncharacterized protein YecE (DUF72 family)
MSKSGYVRVGIGGWNYAPWRGVFYPKGLKQADELAYAANHLTSIEINATHYRLQSAASFRKWADMTPEGFVFSVKGPRIVTNQKALAGTGDFINRFIGSGLAELGDRLGPVLWQFPPFKTFEQADFGKFLELLPRELDGKKLNHVIEVRHASFSSPDYVKLLREHAVGTVYTDAANWPNIADITGEVVYARLQRGDDSLTSAYPLTDLDAWAARAKTLAQGLIPGDLPIVGTKQIAEAKPHDVFVYFIHEGKISAPAAAMALIERLN